MHSEGVAQRSGDIASSAGVSGEVSDVDAAFDVAAEVSASRFRAGELVGVAVDGLALAELNLRTVVDTGNDTEREHQREVFSPSVLALCEALALGGAVGGIVVRIDIHHIVRSVVVILIAALHGECLGSGAEVPVHREVNHREARVLRAVGRVVGIAIEESIVRCAAVTMLSDVVRGELVN